VHKAKSREGGALMFYSSQLSYMHKAAMARAANDVEHRMWEIDRWRKRGEYVVVTVTRRAHNQRPILAGG
jgi:hypothetical protein